LLSGDYDELQPVSGVLLYQKADMYGVMNINGKKLSELNYSEVRIDNGYLIVKKDGKYGVVDTDNHILVPIKYDRFGGGKGNLVREGLLQANLDGRTYLVDLYGNEYLSR
jgi:hypothetical protein